MLDFLQKSETSEGWKSERARSSTQWNKNLHIFQCVGLHCMLVKEALWMFRFVSFSPDYTSLNSELCSVQSSTTLLLRCKCIQFIWIPFRFYLKIKKAIVHIILCLYHSVYNHTLVMLKYLHVQTPMSLFTLFCISPHSSVLLLPKILIPIAFHRNYTHSTGNVQKRECVRHASPGQYPVLCTEEQLLLGAWLHGTLHLLLHLLSIPSNHNGNLVYWY